MTAPRSAAQTIIFMMSAEPSPNTWQLIIFTPLPGVPSPPAMPQTPSPLLLTAPIMPAMRVPWGLGSTSGLFPQKS